MNHWTTRVVVGYGGGRQYMQKALLCIGHFQWPLCGLYQPLPAARLGARLLLAFRLRTRLNGNFEAVIRSPSRVVLHSTAVPNASQKHGQCRQL